MRATQKAYGLVLIEIYQGEDYHRETLMAKKRILKLSNNRLNIRETIHSLCGNSHGLKR